jgi:hypothetical protein
MNKAQFISYIENVEKLNASDSALLADLIKTFPYFQTAHLLYAKSLHNTESIHYNNQLKTTATYAGDRKVLYKLITNKSPEDSIDLSVDATAIKNNSDTETSNVVAQKIIQEELLERAIVADLSTKEINDEKTELQEAIKKIVKEELAERAITVEVETDKSVQNEVEMNITEIPKEELIAEKVAEKMEALLNEKVITEDAKVGWAEMETSLTENSDSLEREVLANAVNSAMEIELLETELLPTEKLSTENNFVLAQITNELEKTEATSIENLSFTDWLKAISEGKIIEDAPLSNISEASTEAKEEEKSLSQFDLIDKFISEEPKMSRPKVEFYNPVNMAKQSVADDITFVSETLAKIFEMQGNYSKALKAYENLHLKYPEKRLYFAAQIKNLRKLINQQNNKK